MGDVIFSLVLIVLLGIAIYKLVPKMASDLEMIMEEFDDEWDEDN